MSTLFSPKIRLILGLTTLLVVILLHNPSKTQQRLSQYPDAENLSLNSAQTQQQITLVSNHENAIVAAEKSNKKSTQQKISSSEKDSGSDSKPYQVIDEAQKYKYSVQPNQVLSPGKLPAVDIDFNQADLLAVLSNTRKYFQDYASADPDISRIGLLGTEGVTVQDVTRTLDFMIAVLQEDIAKNQPTRLQDPLFINSHFRVIKWSGHYLKHPDKKQLRITQYAVFTHSGSHTKTSTFDTPIYSLKDNSNPDKFYTKYTKQDVLSGIYEPGGKEHGKVETLVYLSRKGLEAALMEGTILVNMTDGTKAFFNVDRNNEMSYVRGVSAAAQKRYWYFRQVDAIKGYGYKIDAKISIAPGVTFAGDVLNIGLGKIIVLEYLKDGSKHMHLGVLADTGGAFLPNLHQLDFLAGIFQGEQDFEQHSKQLPDYATAYILVKK